ncbi:PR domain zinc finger protein 2 isoform X2 [Rousettus aegyptiacus]|uniref:PR domain zinc finger protein 2 n=1 Tax=Rousettus aegyptiacus TaxID=9407 RepID=A0A7J8KER9_ROUAE|nr:PR domain zinc finger protein 2 isoform X2 [Rousettus aegyptiacus]XP_016004961.2 PR domain zinc finger protein 2 isoform X2 [Rousettus aegyptiacus]KAF6507386.1 PR/SET domain 2 [Rousettus aegyptiacus]
MNQNTTESGAAAETLAEVPEHVLRGLPEEVRLFPSAVDKSRIGVWATKPILKGKKFGPFVGDKKKRSQVKNNVYMWEVYYPNLGWMCIDATDPEKGNWLRYVNWACSGEEQNLFPLEINRAIYYKTLKPIAPGEELLVWYNGEDNPEIAAAIEEERASARSKRSSPKSRKGKKKPQENKNKGNKTEDIQLKTSEPDSTSANMRDSAEGSKEEDEKTSASAAEPTAALQEVVSPGVLPEPVIPPPACEPQTEPDEKLEAAKCEANDLEEEEEEGEDEEEEEELEEEGEEETDLPNDGSVTEPEMRCDEKLDDLLEEPKNTSKETLEDSPEVIPVIKIPKTKEEANGDVFETFMFPCQHCERKFTTKQGLERHMHIHISTVNHAFKCKYCGKAFGTQINRRRHERRHEAGLKRKPSLALQPSEDPADGRGPADGVTPKEDLNPPFLGQDCLVLNSEKASQETVSSSVVEENGEVKELHPCKYCKKVFGTHTNMRRHQRRVHERHLIPKGVRRKGALEGPQPPAEQSRPAQSVYVPSTEPEEEGEADDVYIMDISSNISENLNYYIDGKIQTSSSTSNCDVIEMESSSADLFGINCLLTPVTVEITQNIKTTQVSITDDLPKEPSSSTNSESKKRRTASPPVLPRIKAEAESDPAAPSCSLSLPLSIATTEAVPFHKEKSVYLSPKLKQLLQTQDKLTTAAGMLATEIPKLGPVCVSAPASMLPVTSSRFKRRTSSPLSSPQHSPALRDFGKQSDGKAVWTEAVLSSKKPKLESHSNSPVWSLSGRDERETASPPGFDEYKVSKDWAASSTFSNVCNQQPLDLSSGVKQKAEGAGKAPVQWESVLDLSVHKKPGSDSEGKEFKDGSLAQPACSAVKKKKPTTCMLQKVLLNEYNGLDAPGEEAPASAGSPSPCKAPHPQPDAALRPESDLPASAVESSPDASPSSPALQTPSLSSRQLPPLLIPTHPSSPPPCPPVLTVATPPPPLLPTIPLPPPSSGPCPSPLSNAAAQSPLPVLSPTVSPSPSPIPPVEPLVSAASPGPPTLSSSSASSSSSSSFSSSSSSSSPSPPPLSAVSSVVSSGDNLEASLPVISFKQEELEKEDLKPKEESQSAVEQDVVQEAFNKNFVCNVCESPFLSIKDLTKHLSIHAEEWPFKCEFCVQLFKAKTDLSEHRFLLHGVGNIFVCSVCKKEFAFLCNLQQHQRDLHPDKVCTHHEFESGTLRPQNFTDPSKARAEHMQSLPEDPLETSKEEEELNDSSEELYTTIKIMASGIKTKDPDVRLGLNQHYPSFKPPPFQYHHRNPMGIGATATNFTTHNIPQTFTTAIRCTKCGKGVDNMPELHKHILACASASDKKRYTPKKNPVPLKQTVQPKNGVVVLDNAGKNAFRRMGQPKRLNFSVELSKMSPNKLKLNALKKKNQLVQRAILQKNRSAKQKADLKNASESSHICPYCNREFTYIGSLNKHAAFSCPKKPLSPSKKKVSHSSKKGGHSSSASSDRNSSSHRRRTADAEIKMQSMQAPLGKTRARSSGPTQGPLPSSSFRSKQNVKFSASVKAKKPGSSLRNSSPIRMARITQVEGKKPKAVAKNHSAQLSGKTNRSLHVRVQKSKAVLQSKSALASKKRTDRFSVKSRERSGGPITRSLQLAAAADPNESRREDSSGKQELKDVSYSLRLATRCPASAAPYVTRQCRSVKAAAAVQLQGPLSKE